MRTLLVAIMLFASVSVADYLLYDKTYRDDILHQAYAAFAPLAHANAGAPRINFSAIEGAGSEKWLVGPGCFGSRAFSICYDGSSNSDTVSEASRMAQCREFDRCVQSNIRTDIKRIRRAALRSQNSMTLVNSAYTNGWYR